jgi:hypothetical protein
MKVPVGLVIKNAPYLEHNLTSLNSQCTPELFGFPDVEIFNASLDKGSSSS